MNEILKNTHIFVDVLSMARCDAVQQWDEGAFQKAYKWSNYFEEVGLRVLGAKTLKTVENYWIATSTRVRSFSAESFPEREQPQINHINHAFWRIRQ